MKLMSSTKHLSLNILVYLQYKTEGTCICLSVPRTLPKLRRYRHKIVKFYDKNIFCEYLKLL